MNPIAVIDVETTGLNTYRNDRIIEIAIIQVHPHDGIISEIDTLVNPERDIGPSSIHGLSSTDIINAPLFADIGGHLAEALSGSVALAGHNVRFDISFLQAEYERMGIVLPHYHALDTMSLAGGGTLSACCLRHGIPFDGEAHAALNDTRATARLLLKLIKESPDALRNCELSPPSWPRVPPAKRALFGRTTLPETQRALPTYIQRLAGSLSETATSPPPAEAERDYRALLWTALEDGRIDETEADALVSSAQHWRIPFDLVESIHLEYLCQLTRAACADRHLSDADRTEILAAARLLGFGTLSQDQLQDLLHSTKSTDPTADMSVETEDWKGKTVCFTGESICSIEGSLITRTTAERLASAHGLHAANSVTKKLDLLVVADPNTQSGKAKKARQYGIRIVHEPRFWRGLGIQVD